MKKENISNALNNIDFDMVEDVYDSTMQKKKTRKILWHKSSAIAASLALIIIAAMVALPQLIAPRGSMEEPLTDSTDPWSTEAEGTKSPDPSLSAPKEFTSIEEFVAHEKSLGKASSKCYYIPSTLGDDYELYSIVRQEKNTIITYEHITVKYKLKGANINEESYNDVSTKIISCEYSVKEYSDAAFESYTKNGFEAFEYGEKLLYKKDNYTADNTTLLSYKVIFRVDGHLIAMNLPAVDSFENMIKHTDVIRMDIE